MTRRSIITFVLAMLALASLACNLTGTGDAPADAPAAAVEAPTVEIRVPVNGMEFAEGTTVIIQVVGTDNGTGVSQIDLQVDDLPAGSLQAPNPAGQTAFIANFEWPAQGIGGHSITAIAMRADGTASPPATISVNVVQAQPTAVPPTNTPEPTAVPEEQEPAEEEPTEEPEQVEEEPTEEPTPSGPTGVTTAGVNVRRGPGTGYDVIGSLLAGFEMELNGRNADSTWFRAPYALSEGWIYAPLLTTSGDTGSLPVINVPPPPPTATPIPPTPIPATAAPATTAPSQSTVDFRSTATDGQTYPPGTVIRFIWNVTGVKEVYFDGQAVTGSGEAERTVNSSRSYTLRVVYPDGSVREFSIPIGIN
jgi:uncharacterized protein YraI